MNILGYAHQINCVFPSDILILLISCIGYSHQKGGWFEKYRINHCRRGRMQDAPRYPEAISQCKW